MKLGKLPPRPTDPKVPLEAFLWLDKLTPPPPSIDWSMAVSDWGMLLNDRLGDCVCAGILHCAQLATALETTEFVPTDADALKLYELIGHYDPSDPSTDRGVVMFDAMNELAGKGFMGQKLDAFASLDIHNLDILKTACDMVGPIPIGIEFPSSAMDQFNAGQPWDVTYPPATIEGGHCVVVVGYDETYFQVITWGKVQLATNAFMQKYMDEAYALLSKLWFENGIAPDGLNYEALVAAFKALPKAN